MHLQVVASLDLAYYVIVIGQGPPSPSFSVGLSKSTPSSVFSGVLSLCQWSVLFFPGVVALSGEQHRTDDRAKRDQLSQKSLPSHSVESPKSSEEKSTIVRP